MSWVVGDTLSVIVTKVTLGKDGKTYLTVHHPSMANLPSFIVKEVMPISKQP